jgi:hypothetical protein
MNVYGFERDANKGFVSNRMWIFLICKDFSSRISGQKIHFLHIFYKNSSFNKTNSIVRRTNKVNWDGWAGTMIGYGMEGGVCLPRREEFIFW